MGAPESENPCFGPVPSRRLGRSLGVNNVPYKTCSYSCVYCQLGPTVTTTARRRSFRSPNAIIEAIRGRLGELDRRGETVDYVTFVPDGEPTLDLGLEAALCALEEGATPTAVITNASLVSDPDVVRALRHASWVSLKVDAADEATWRAINRPDPALRFEDLAQGAARLSDGFRGTLVTETMLVAGVNDDERQLHAIADRVADIGPQTAYLAIPTRPAGETWVRPPSEEAIARAYAIFGTHGIETELLAGHPQPTFLGADDPSDAILRITAVHPMRRVEVQRLLDESDASWSCVDALVADGALRSTRYRDEEFFVRAFAGAARSADPTRETEHDNKPPTRGDQQMGTDHSQLHGEHLDWQSEHERWTKDLRAWQDETASLTARLGELLGAALQRHEREITSHRASIDTHESTLAAAEHQADPDDLLHRTHRDQAERHAAARARHHAIASRLAQLRELVAALEAASTPRTGASR